MLDRIKWWLRIGWSKSMTHVGTLDGMNGFHLTEFWTHKATGEKRIVKKVGF